MPGYPAWAMASARARTLDFTLIWTFRVRTEKCRSVVVCSLGAATHRILDNLLMARSSLMVRKAGRVGIHFKCFVTAAGRRAANIKVITSRVTASRIWYRVKC